MRSVFLITLLTLIVACNDAAKPPVLVKNSPTPAPATPPPAAEHTDDGHDAPRISLADAKKDYDAGTAVLVDVRDASAYKLEHIKGSLNMTLAEIAAKADKLPKGKKIIAYCS